jgi:hypothetical protein
MKLRFPCLILLIGCILACLGLGSLPLSGQSFFGSIVGTVTDDTGGVVPSAAVSITNLGTSEKKSAETDAVGNYRFLNLVPGNYRVDVELTGFKHFTRTNVAVQVESVVRIDAVLQLGVITDTIEVTSQSPLLQTDSGTLSQVIESQTVQEMPLNGRNVLNLIALAPGVVSQGATAGTPVNNSSSGHTNDAGWNNYQIGGGLTGQAASFVDGAPTNGLGSNAVTLIMTQDAIQEFRVATNSVSAEFGRFGGGVINFATKSGTNDFHGSAYEYFRDTSLNAANFFANLAGQEKPRYNQHQYGGTFSGPVKKGKAFFFVNYEQFKSSYDRTLVTTVPTLAQRAGDFSGGKTIYDPLTTIVSGSTVTRTAFANNIIPANRIDYTANAIANTKEYWPKPNVSLPSGNLVYISENGGLNRQFTGRFDANLSDRQRMFLRYTYWKADDLGQNYIGTGFGAPGFHTTHQGVFGDTYSFTATTTFDFRLSFTRGSSGDTLNTLGVNLSDYGSGWATLQPQVSLSPLLVPFVTGLYQFQGTSASRDYRNSWVGAFSLYHTVGNHNLKFGADLRMMDDNGFSVSGASNTGGATGTYRFNGALTSLNATASSSSGNPFADFMLGYPNQGAITTVHPTSAYSFYQAYYATDTWQIGKSLTVNLGIRWELPGAWAERNDAATVLLPDETNPVTPSYKGVLALVNSSLWPSKYTEETKHSLFAPRVGFAYRMPKNTVLRMGYGISYLAMDTSAGAQPYGSPINSASTTMAATVNNANRLPLNTLSYPFPRGGVPGTVQQSILQPTGRSQEYLDSLTGLSITGAIPWLSFPYVQQWNLSLQREFLPGTMFQVSYVGSKGTHLPMSVNLNQLPDGYNSRGSALLTTVPNPMAGLVNPAGSLNGATVSAGQLLRPYPEYTNVTWANARLGDNIYHAMQMSLQKRFGAAGVLTVNYTWSKNIGDVSATTNNSLEGLTVGSNQNYYNLRADRSLINFNAPSNFVVSYVMDLPFGKGKKFLGGATGVTGKLVSGWGVNGIVNLRTGFPLSIVDQSNTLNSTFGAGTIRPNEVIGCVKTFAGRQQDRINQWFNSSCFTQPGPYYFGSQARVDNKIRASGVNNFDFTISKNTVLSERFSLQFRAEAFNLFNRVQFGAPGTTRGTASTFGIVSVQANNPRQLQLAVRLLF